MSTAERILLVDDDPRFNQVTAEALRDRGYQVEAVLSAEQALQRLQQADWALVLLDRKLQGPAGPDTGLALIAKVQRAAPAARIILITGYADPDSVLRAFDAGVYDYIQKDECFEAMLAVKVRNALEPARERRMAALANGDREAAIRALYADALAETDRNRKGRLLEELLLLLVKSIPGFERALLDVQTEHEQFDVVVPNESVDPFWHKESPYLLVECKNWSGKVGPDAVNHFYNKLEARNERCKLGLLVAPGGFTEGCEKTLLQRATKSLLVILVAGDELWTLVDAGSSPQRNDALKALHQRAIVGSTAH